MDSKNRSVKIILRKITKIIMMFAAIIFFFLLIFTGILLYYSPGKPQMYTDNSGNISDGSISEKVIMKIGGVNQGMFIRSRDIKNPVLLYLHGGPSFPNYFLIDKYEPGLEEIFTVCYWEQRGGGLSYSSDVTLESMTFDQLTSDAIEVTNYLRERFGKEKIFLMAHSGGSPIGIMAASKVPQLYNAYISMAQITNQSESEKIAYKYMLEKCNSDGKPKAVEELKKYPVADNDTNIIQFYKSVTRDKYMHELGIGTMRNMNSIFLDVFIPVWTCKAYTLTEKFNIWISKFSFLNKTNLIGELFKLDIPAKIPRLEIPVYFFSGKYDLTVNKDLSKAYLEKLQAPIKGFYTFENSAHSPLYEEPERIRDIIKKDVLNLTVNLADKK
jgi:pimeloyl-ACP methyl ester carboxylesterase